MERQDKQELLSQIASAIFGQPIMKQGEVEGEDPRYCGCIACTISRLIDAQGPDKEEVKSRLIRGGIPCIDLVKMSARLIAIPQQKFLDAMYVSKAIRREAMEKLLNELQRSVLALKPFVEAAIKEGSDAIDEGKKREEAAEVPSAHGKN